MAEIKGRIESISPIQQIPTKSGKVMEKRELVLDATRYDPLTGERGFDNFPLLEFSGERCKELDNFQLGEAVTVSYNLEGMRYTDKGGLVKYFTKAIAYKIEAIKIAKRKQTPIPTQTQQPPTYPNYQHTQQVKEPWAENSNNNLPF